MADSMVCRLVCRDVCQMSWGTRSPVHTISEMSCGTTLGSCEELVVTRHVWSSPRHVCSSLDLACPVVSSLKKQYPYPGYSSHVFRSSYIFFHPLFCIFRQTIMSCTRSVVSPIKYEFKMNLPKMSYHRIWFQSRIFDVISIKIYAGQRRRKKLAELEAKCRKKWAWMLQIIATIQWRFIIEVSIWPAVIYSRGV